MIIGSINIKNYNGRVLKLSNSTRFHYFLCIHSVIFKTFN